MIRRNVTIPAPASRVWEALTDPGKLSSWFGGVMEWRAVPGAPLTFRGDDGERREGRVEEVRPERRLRFVWWPADGDPAEGASEVTYLLEPSGDSTRLTIQEQVVASSGPPIVVSAARGWDTWDDRLAGAWVDLSARQQLRARA